MDARTAAARAAGPVGALGAVRFAAHPELAELNDLHRWHRVYFAGRAGPVAHLPSLVEALFWFFPHDVVRASLGTVAEREGLASFTPRYLAAVAAIGDRVFGPLANADELAGRLAALVAALDRRGAPMASAWLDVPAPTTTGAAIEHHVTVLREFRFDQHVHVLVAHGLDGLEAVAFTAVWKGDDVGDRARFFGWRDEEALRAAVDRLVVSGRIGTDGALTEAGREEREAIEGLTNALAAHPWSALSGDDRGRLVDLLEDAQAAVRGAS